MQITFTASEARDRGIEIGPTPAGDTVALTLSTADGSTCTFEMLPFEAEELAADLRESARIVRIGQGRPALAPAT